MSEIEIGKINSLKVVKEVDFGMYLDGGEHGEILIPQKYIPKGVKIDDFIDVIVYTDTEDRLIATTEKPLAQVGDFAYLRVVAVNTVGAFLDWGLLKDLFVPYREQKSRMEEGRKYVVYIYLDDESQRQVGSSKLEKFTGNIIPEYQEGDEVDLLIVNKTDIGYKVVIDNLHIGLIYENEVFRKLKVGEITKGYIKKMRADEKIDISLQKSGYQNIGEVAEKVLRILKENNGKMTVCDKSSPELISKYFQISKKAFKKAIGTLYKQKLILISKDEIKLAE